MRTAILFDQYGHPVQPFLRNWYLRLKEHSLHVQAFTFNFAGSPDTKNEIVQLGVASGKADFYSKLLRQKLSRDEDQKRWMDISRENSSARKLQAYTIFKPLIDYKPDVIHLLNVQEYERYKDVIQFLNVPFVVSFRGFDTSVKPYVDAGYREMLEEVYLKGTRFQFVSSFLVDEAEKLGAVRSKCETIYRSIDLSTFSKSGSSVNGNTKPVILSVCRLTWQKGLEYALKSMKMLDESGIDFEYRIIGDGKEKEKLVYLARMFGIADKVIFVGHQPRELIREEMDKADIMLQSSISEALPNTLIEAAAMQLPVAGTYAGGIPEVVDEGKSGLLTPIADPEALYKALKHLIQNDDLRHKMGKAGKELAESRFGPERECEQYAALYRGAAGQNTSAS
ncbi:MAG: glycosyltransferase family 4 protein [Cyclobacteriaceae bacterium]